MVLPHPSSTGAECTCRHFLDCNCGCHGRHCDPTEHSCSLEFLPDEGGFTPWGCAECTPGAALAHLADCASLASAAPHPAMVSDAGGGIAPSAR